MVYVCSGSRAGEDGAAPGTAPHLPTGCVHVPGPCPCHGAMSLSWGHVHVLGAAGAGDAVPALGRPSQQPLTHHCCGWLCSWLVNIDWALKTIVFLFFFGFLQPPSGPAPVALCAAHWGLWGDGAGAAHTPLDPVVVSCSGVSWHCCGPDLIDVASGCSAVCLLEQDGFAVPVLLIVTQGHLYLMVFG